MTNILIKFECNHNTEKCPGGPCNVVTKVLDSGFEVNEFELQSLYYFHFRTNTLRKVMNLPIPKL